MRRSKKRRPELEEKLDKVNRQVREVRGRLRRRVDQALVPLSIQEDTGISQLRGQVLIISYNDDLQNKIKNVLESENYRCDIASGSSKAVGMLRLAKISTDNCGLYPIPTFQHLFVCQKISIAC